MSQITETNLNSLSSEWNIGRLPTTIQMNGSPLSNQDFTASGKRGSAVLMLFCAQEHRDNSDNSDSHLVFIRRSTKVKTHKGQISFPGGRSEPSDRSPEETAVRETVEEIGIDGDAIKVIGQLLPSTGLDGSLIVPVVGILTAPTPFRPDPNEVEYVFTAPWSQFNVAQSFQFVMFGHRRSSSLYEASGHRIWGLTASMLTSAGMR